MYSPNSLKIPSFPRTMMFDNMTQDDINQMMIEGKIQFLLPKFLPQLRSTPRPWSIKRAYINDFSELENIEFWQDHDWP